MLLPRGKRVEHEHLTGRVDVEPVVERVDDDLARGQPGLVQVVEPGDELASGQGRGSDELGLQNDNESFGSATVAPDPMCGKGRGTHVQHAVVRLLVPPRVERADPRAQVGPRLVPSRLGRDELGHAVVDAVDGLDEVLVQLDEELLDGRVGRGEREVGCNDVETKVPGTFSKQSLPSSATTGAQV